MNKNSLDFFLGANSKNGFFSYFDDITTPRDGFRSYIIKGGAGTGKSSLMKKIASKKIEENQLIEQIHCSSDPNSLDGVIMPESKSSILDGTLPHAVEPRYIGAFEIVINLCDFFNNELLFNRLTQIVELSDKINNEHKRCCRFLNANSKIISDNFNIAKKATDFEKLNKYIKRITTKEFSRTKGDGGLVKNRLLSAITPNGIVMFNDTVSKLAKKIYIIKDDFGVVSQEILNQIKQSAINHNHTIYCCYCPISGGEKLEHIIIPKLELAFVTNNYFLKSSFENVKTININRFTDMILLREFKQRLTFNKKVLKELLSEAIISLKNAKKLHDNLELLYTDAVDFNLVDRKTKQLLDEI